VNFSQSKYRITYEAFSKFSSKLSKANTLEEVGEVTLANLKYFFNYHFLRINCIIGENQLCYLFNIEKCEFLYTQKKLLNEENQLLQKEIPIYKDISAEAVSIISSLGLPDLEKPKLYASYFDYGSIATCVSIISDEKRQFGMDDVEILRLLTDAFVSKTKQIRLQNKLEEKNNEYKVALEQIDYKNKEIESIVNTQKAIIKLRTKNIVERNDQLVDILQSISHNLQEPLSRILGLLHLTEGVDQDEFINDILPFLRESAVDLDTVFKDLVEKNVENVKLISKENDK